MHLSRCLRIMPHDQDTGGFFVAVFERIADHVEPVAKKVKSVVHSVAVSDPSKDHMQILNTNKNKALSTANAHKPGSDVTQSIEAMRRLGYNPKNLATAGGVLASSRDLTSSELETYTAELGVNVSDGISKLMLSTISLEFTSLMNAKSRAKKDAQSGEEKKADQQPVKKKKFNGIFGSKSHGWAIQTEEDSEEGMDREERESERRVMEGENTHRIVLMSKSVHSALHSWGKKLYTVQAGVSVAEGV
eukprot:gene41276-51102_t